MSGIFPQSSTEAVNSIIISSKTPVYGKSPIFLFESGEFKKVDGRVYTGESVEVLKNWIEKTLRTERYRFPVYTSNYGVTLEELVSGGLPYETLLNELKGQISDALLQDIRITGVGSFCFSRDKSYLNIQFVVKTFDEETITMEVKV
jgi:hypothetical protein